MPSIHCKPASASALVTAILIAASAAPAIAGAQVDSAKTKPDSTAASTPKTTLTSVTVKTRRPRPVTGYLAKRSTTATKTDTPLRDVPQAIAVVTQEQIKDQGMQSMADVTRYVPGISFAQGEGNRDTPILRGNSTTADFFVDGTRDDLQYIRDLYNVDRVEAIKGSNAMIFGRGGAGGVINRVTKQASWEPTRELTLQGGSQNNRRASGDFGAAMNDALALRLTGLYENSDSYRHGVNMERYGVNPTAAVGLGGNTTVRFGYEYFDYTVTADRGIPSFRGKPVKTDVSTFFGDPNRSSTNAKVNTGNTTIEHRFSDAVKLRNRTNYGRYNKFYQNIFPGAVDTSGTTVAISGYSNATNRTSIFNQTDLVSEVTTGHLAHTLLLGTELGRQITDNFRTTGYFNNTTTSTTAPVSNPVVTTPVTWRQSATDANNHSTANVTSFYAQDQLALSKHVQAVLGLRYDVFSAKVRNNRTSVDLSSKDKLWSPRVGLIVKPVEPLSLYSSYSIAYQPRAGEQLASLSVTNQALDPEQFKNYEVGAKWDLNPNMAITLAGYRLDRSNVAVTDPNDPTKTLLVDGQRTNGIELGFAGQLTSAWNVMAAYAYQDGYLTADLSATAKKGATLAQLPKNSVSLWNRYDLTPMLGVGLGVSYQGNRFTTTDNTVTLPSYTLADGALFFTLNPRIRAQINVDNLFDTKYYRYANGNNNITPGSPRVARVQLTTSY